MSKCTLCNKSTSIFTRSTFKGLSGFVCSECRNHVQSLRNCYYGSKSSIPHISYLKILKENIISPESQLFISNELLSHENHIKTDADAYVEEKLSSRPICTSNFKLIDGLTNWPQNILIISIEIYDDCLMFWRAATSKQNQSPMILKIKSILSTEYLTEKEIVEKSKNVVGRAATGALLFGPVGALIGGMSGVGNSQKQKSHIYYIIHFINAQEKEAIITLETGCANCNHSLFNKSLQEKLVSNNIQSPTFL